MAAVGMAEDPVVQAARILINLRHRRLQRWPEWVPKAPAAAEADVCCSLPREIWPKRQRNGNRVRSSNWRTAWAAPLSKQEGPVVVACTSAGYGACSSYEEQDRAPLSKQESPVVVASTSAGYGACSSGEEQERAPPRWTERSSVGRPIRDEVPARMSGTTVHHYSAPVGSGPSTSAARKARSPASVGAPPKKDPMKELSPETPLYYGAAAGSGSGASSSGGDDVARPAPAKRRVLGSAGGASSGDEGCSSPDKRARVDAGDDSHGEKQLAISEPKTQQQTPNADKKGSGVVKFEFDLNMPCPEDDQCPAGFY